MIGSYIFFICALLLIYLFFLFLPQLNRCRLPAPLSDNADDRKLRKKDAFIICAVSIVYAVTAFVRLGNTSSPQTFASFHDGTITIEAEQSPAAIAFYTGTGTGTYSFSFSEDGEFFYGETEFEQNYVELMKWEKLEAEFGGGCRYVRIQACGDCRLGELFLLDRNGAAISYSIVPSLTDYAYADRINDEQTLLQGEQTFMNSSVFDEIYHVRTAYEHMNAIRPYEISHPPLGKLIIALGIRIFGLTPFGWRFSGTFFGVLMLPIIYIFAKKMFGGYLVPTGCSILMATDFMHFVQTRLATIDTYAVFFIILMYLFMYLFINTGKRKWLILCGVFFGIGAASKWTCLYAGAGLAVLWAVYWIRNRKLGFNAFIKNVWLCILFFIAVPCLIYYVSYIPYGLAEGVAPVFSREYLDIVLENQKFMFSYHSSLVSTHPYSSVWYQWLLDIRPILYYLKYFNDGSRSSFGAFVNPALCWGGLGALAVCIYEAVFRRDRNAGFILTGYLAQLLPWVFVPRLTFEYHYFPCTVFLCLSLGYVFSLYEKNRDNGKYGIIYFLTLSTGLFIMFYPVLSGQRVDSVIASKLLGWLPTWPF